MSRIIALCAIVIGGIVLPIQGQSAAETSLIATSFRLYQYVPRLHEVFFGGQQRPGPAKILAFDVDSRQLRIVADSGARSLFGFRVGASGYVAVLERRLQETDRLEQGVIQQRSESGRLALVREETVLRILSSDGNEVAAIPAVRDYDWNRDGTALVVATGNYRGHDVDFEPTGVSVYSMQTGSAIRVAADGNYVRWADFDGSVYIWDTMPPKTAHVLRYRYDGALEATPYHSIYFSATGDYYYKPEAVLGRPEIYLRQTNQGLTATSTAFADVTAFEPTAWAPKGDALLMRIRRRGEPQVVSAVYEPSVNAMTVLRDAPEILGWGSDAQTLLVKVEGTFGLQAIDPLARR